MPTLDLFQCISNKSHYLILVLKFQERFSRVGCLTGPKNRSKNYFGNLFLEIEALTMLVNRYVILIVMHQILRYDWLLRRADKMALSCLFGTAVCVSQEKFSPSYVQLNIGLVLSFVCVYRLRPFDP